MSLFPDLFAHQARIAITHNQRVLSLVCCMVNDAFNFADISSSN